MDRPDVDGFRVVGDGRSVGIVTVWDAVGSDGHRATIVMADVGGERVESSLRPLLLVNHPAVRRVMVLWGEPVIGAVLDGRSGPTLAGLTSTTQLSEAAVARLGAQVLRGLGALHQRGTAHGRLGPEAIVVEGWPHLPKARLGWLGPPPESCVPNDDLPALADVLERALRRDAETPRAPSDALASLIAQLRAPDPLDRPLPGVAARRLEELAPTLDQSPTPEASPRNHLTPSPADHTATTGVEPVARQAAFVDRPAGPDGRSMTDGATVSRRPRSSEPASPSSASPHRLATIHGGPVGALGAASRAHLASVPGPKPVSLWTGPVGDDRRYRVDLVGGRLVSVGQGGQGLVYPAVRVLDGVATPVALKVLTEVHLDHGPGLLERAAVLQGVAHPHLMEHLEAFLGPALQPSGVPVNDDEFEVLYSASRWIPGRSLPEAVADSGVAAGLAWVAQVARGAQHLHGVLVGDERGVVHRDIKPSNVRVDDACRAVLLDFDIARPAQGDHHTSGIGTHHWRAPELLGGPGAPGLASDRWGVGALASWVLTGRPVDLGSNVPVSASLTEAAARAGLCQSAAIGAHIASLLAAHPDERPADLGEWADQLDAVLAGRPPRWYRTARSSRLAAIGGAVSVAVVVAALMLWPSAAPEAPVERGALVVALDTTTSTAPTATTTATTTTTTEPEPPTTEATTVSEPFLAPPPTEATQPPSPPPAPQEPTVTVVRRSPKAVAGIGDRVLVANSDDETISILDASSGSVIGEMIVRGGPGSLITVGSSVWVANFRNGTLTEVDPFEATIRRTIEVGPNPRYFGATGDTLWFVRGENLARLNTVTGVVDEVLALTPDAFHQIAAGEGTVWVNDEFHWDVRQVDPFTGSVVRSVDLTPGVVPGAMTVGHGSLWVSTSSQHVYRIDLASGTISARVFVPLGCGSLAAGGNAIWAVCGTQAVRIDPGSNQSSVIAHIERTGYDITLHAGALWIPMPYPDTSDGFTLVEGFVARIPI